MCITFSILLLLGLRRYGGLEFIQLKWWYFYWFLCMCEIYRSICGQQVCRDHRSWLSHPHGSLTARLGRLRLLLSHVAVHGLFQATCLLETSHFLFHSILNDICFLWLWHRFIIQFIVCLEELFNEVLWSVWARRCAFLTILPLTVIIVDKTLLVLCNIHLPYWLLITTSFLCAHFYSLAWKWSV